MSKQVMISLAVIVLLVIVGGAVWVTKKSGMTSVPTSVDTTTQTPIDTMASNTPIASASDSAMNMGTVKEFTVTGSNFKFEPATLSVNKGDTVKITFKNSGGMHNLVFNDFNATTKTIQSGATDTIQFTADKSGSFQYYCSVGNHKAMGMVGTLTVK